MPLQTLLRGENPNVMSGERWGETVQTEKKGNGEAWFKGSLLSMVMPGAEGRPLCLSWRSVNASRQATARLGLLTLIRLYIDRQAPDYKTLIRACKVTA